MLNVFIPEIPVVNALALLIGDIGASFRECFRDRSVGLQQMILEPTGDVEGREPTGRIALYSMDATVWFDRTLCIKLILGKVWYSLLVLIFGLCGGIASFPHVGPCRGLLVGMAARVAGLAGKARDRANVGLTWVERGDTSSKRRTVRNDDGVF